jgi:hypothetical protein
MPIAIVKQISKLGIVDSTVFPSTPLEVRSCDRTSQYCEVRGSFPDRIDNPLSAFPVDRVGMCPVLCNLAGYPFSPYGIVFVMPPGGRIEIDMLPS